MFNFKLNPLQDVVYTKVRKEICYAFLPITDARGGMDIVIRFKIG